MNRNTARAMSVALALVSGLALAGCTNGESTSSPTASGTPTTAPSASPSAAPGAAGDQSKAEACTQLEDGMQKLQDEVSTNLEAFQTDPTAASEALQALSDTFAQNVDSVSNEEVKAAAVSAGDALGSLVDNFSAYAADPASVDTTALAESATAVQTSFAEVGTICAT